MPIDLDFKDPFESNAPAAASLDFKDPFDVPAVQSPAAQQPKLKRTWTQAAADTGIDLVKGVVGAGEAAVGLLDLPTGGYAGKGMEAIGWRPKDTQEILSSAYSDPRKEAEEKVANAEGFIDTAGAMLENPSTIAGSVVQSVPSIIGGGAVAKLPGIAKLASRYAVGEGAVMAGAQAETIRQQTDDGLLSPMQTAAAIGTGVLGGAAGVLGGKFSRALGITDVDALAAGVAGQATTKNFVRRGAEGALVEGFAEEMPQSAMEQTLQNVALDKPTFEGVPEAAAAGVLTGAAVGGPIAALPSRSAAPEAASNDVEKSEQPVVEPVVQAPMGTIERAASMLPKAAPIAEPANTMASAVDALPEKQQKITEALQQVEAQFGQPATTADGRPAVISKPVNAAAKAPAPPWVNAETGEMANPTDDQIKQELRNQRSVAQGSRSAVRLTNAQLETVWGIPADRIRALRKEVNKEPVNADEQSRVESQPDTGELDLKPFVPTTDGNTALDQTAKSTLSQSQSTQSEGADSDLQVPDTEQATRQLLDQDNSIVSETQPGSPGEQGQSKEPAIEAVEESPSAQDTPAQSTAQAEYDESTDVLDDDVTTQSGTPFSVRGAAEVAAKREGETARVIPVDGGFVVRQPKAQGAVPNEPARAGKIEPAAVDGIGSVQPNVADVADAQDTSALPADRNPELAAKANPAPAKTKAVEKAVPPGTTAERLTSSVPAEIRPVEQPQTNKFPLAKPKGGVYKNVYHALDPQGEPLVAKNGKRPEEFSSPKAAQAYAERVNAKRAQQVPASGVTAAPNQSKENNNVEGKQTLPTNQKTDGTTVSEKSADAKGQSSQELKPAKTSKQPKTDAIAESNKTLGDRAESFTLPGKGNGVPAAEVRVAKNSNGKYQFAQGFTTGTTGSGASFNFSKEYETADEAKAAGIDEILRLLPKTDLAAGEEARVAAIRKWAAENTPALKTVERRNAAERQRVDSLPADQRDVEIERLRQEIRTDDLTGLLNAKAWRADEQDGTRLPHMALIDLDLFKGYNDLLGYEGADQALKLFGGVMNKANPGGKGYRRGGDEFILTAETPEAIAQAVKRLKNLSARVRIRLTGKTGEQMIITGIPHSAGIGIDEQSASKQLEQIKGTKPSSRAGAEPSNITRDDGVRAKQSEASRVPATEPERKDGSSDVTQQTPPTSGVSDSGVDITDGWWKNNNWQSEYDLTAERKALLLEAVAAGNIIYSTGAISVGKKKINVTKQEMKFVGQADNAKQLRQIEERELAKSIVDAAHEAATSPKNDAPVPTDAQKEAGNYKKGHIVINGLDISIENPAGSKRRPEWPTLKYHYGYFKRTEGADGDHVDVFVSDDASNAELPVFIVDQFNKDGTFDEHKVMLGFPDEAAAKAAYLSNYTKGWKVGPITQMSLEDFKTWLKGDTTKPLADNWIGADRVFSSTSTEEYGPMGADQAALAFARQAPAGTTTLEIKSRPSGKQWNTLYLSTGNGEIESHSIGPERTAKLSEILNKIKEKADNYAKNRQALQKVIDDRMALAIENGFVLGAKIGSITPNTGKTLHKAEIVKVHNNGELDVQGMAGSRQAVIKEMDPSGLIRAIARYKNAKPAPVVKQDLTTEPNSKIEDFGETLLGARKHYAHAYADKMKDAAELDIATQPLSKVWPEPDYDKLIEAGASPYVAAWVHAARDEIPTKPTKPWRVKGWVESVSLLRGVANKLLAGEITEEKLRETFESDLYKRLFNGLGGRVDLYNELGHGFSFKGVRFGSHHFSLYRGESNVTKWMIESRAGKGSNWPTELAVGNTREEAIAQFKAKYANPEKLDQAETKKQTKFVIYSYPGTKMFVVGKKLGKNYIDLESFDDVKAARAYIVDNYDALVAKLAEKTKLPSERRATNEPRVGADHRSGADVTPAQFSETFGFRGVQFGNYVEGARRQSDLNRAYDALADLAGVIGVSMKALSLNGSLGLAFGARGKGGKQAPAAHYEAGSVVINLTKTGGAGSLAHEWFHALDNYFSRARNDKHGFVTNNPSSASAGMRPEMVKAFTRVMNAIKETKLQARSVNADSRRSKPYFATNLEMAARSFESYVIAKLQDQNAANDYLANIASPEYWEAATQLGLEKGGSYPYPDAGELPTIRAAFDEFFNTIQSEPGESGNVKLFRKPDAGVQTGNALSMADGQRLKTQFTKNWGDRAPTVVVVETAEGFPADVKVDPDYRRAEGVFNGKKTVWINLDKIRSGVDFNGKPQTQQQKFAEVLTHEALGHYGVENVVGAKDWSQITHAIGLLRKNGNGSDTVKSAMKSAERRYGNESPEVFAKEFIAIMAERGLRNGLVDRVIVKVRQFLRKIMPSLVLNDREIVNLLHQADKFLHQGTPQQERQAQVRAMAFSLAPNGQPLSEFFKALAKFDKAFQYPISKKESLMDIMGDIMPTERLRLKISDPKVRTRFAPNEKIVPATRTVIQLGENPKHVAVVWEEADGNRLYLDASALEPGITRGSALYMSLFNYAHNNGKVFIGDPHGLSDEALLRRTELMAAAAIKFKATWFMAPHPRQVKPDKQWATPVKWTDGDVDGNTESLLQSAYNQTVFFAPEINNVYFDFDSGNFRGADGRIISERELDRIARSARAAFQGRPNNFDDATAAAFGRSTIARGMLANTVLRGAGQTGSGVVDSLQGQLGSGNTTLPKALKERMYSKPEPLAEIKRNFKEATGDDIEIAGTKLASIDVRNGMREAGNNKTPIESYPYTDEQIALIDQYNDMKNPSSKYLFHTTPAANISSIAESGLVPGSAQRFEGVGNGRISLSANAAAAAYYGGDSDVMIRVSKNYEFNDLEADLLAGADGVYTTNNPIPPEALEVKSGRKWIPLKQYIETNKPDPAESGVLVEQTETDAFKKWFGDSKVVDADGKPLVVYHGAGDKFDTFEGDIAFFTDDQAVAEEYADDAGGPVMDVYLSLKNPKVFKNNPSDADIQAAKKAGHDGAIVRSKIKRDSYGVPDDGQVNNGVVYITFNPSQIKSATGNSGDFNAKNPSILFSKQAPADLQADIEAVMSATRSDTIKDRATQWLKTLTPGKVKDSLRSTWLGGLTLRHLAELGESYLPGVERYMKYVQQMGADRNQLQEEADVVAEELRTWASKNREEAKRLAKLQHDSTIEGNDPSKAFKMLQFTYNGKVFDATKENVTETIEAIKEQMRGRSGDKKTDMLARIKEIRGMPARNRARMKTYAPLVARWNKLSPKAQELYKKQRDMYTERSELMKQALIDRVKDLSVTGDQKQRVISMIRDQFESARLQGVYFPLQRFGKYFVSAEKDGTPAFLMFEDLNQLDTAVKSLRDKGYKINAQGYKGDGKAKDAPSGTFVADVVNALDKAGVSLETQDTIYQIYLQALPELSMRKHSIHRQAIQGFDPDAIRAFAYNMHHGAHQLARLRYSHVLESIRDGLKDSQDMKRKEADADTRQITAGDTILDELGKRHEWIMNPTDSNLVNTISGAGFVYYLGITPAASLVNMTQTALITFPYLASRFGPMKAMSQLMSSMKDSARTVGNIDKTLKTEEEHKAYAQLKAMGSIDKTQAHNLAGIAESGTNVENAAWAKAMKIIGWGFHKTEVVNREASGMAAFRLARESGMEFDEAVAFADRTIADTHFDYTNANRARFMQSGPAKVLLMFRQYSLNMTWFLGRNVWNATKGESPEVKKLARRNLVGVLGMSAIFSGTLGLPLMSVTFGVINAIAASLGDDDEPFDAETEFRNFLADMFGTEAANVIATGAVNKVTGADIASRVSLSQLWFRDADRELDGRGMYYHLLEQAAGPMGGVLKNVLVGKQLIDDGKLGRGVETMLPKALKDGMKAVRYATEGVNNLRGDPLVADPSLFEVLLQLNGFTPKEVAEQYDTNRALKNYEKTILDRRTALIDAFAMANRMQDVEAKREVVAKIRDFNKTNPEVGITQKTLNKSIVTRARYTQDAVNGIVLNKKLSERSKENARFSEQLETETTE